MQTERKKLIPDHVSNADFFGDERHIKTIRHLFLALGNDDGQLSPVSNRLNKRLVFRFSWNGANYYIKHYASHESRRLQDKFHALSFMTPLGENIFHRLHELNVTGLFPVIGGWKWPVSRFSATSTLLMREASGLSLPKWIAKDPENDRIRQVLGDFMGIIRQFHEKGYVHGDPALSNVYFHEESGIQLIDPDSIRRQAWRHDLLARDQAKLLATQIIYRSRLASRDWRSELIEDWQDHYRRPFCRPRHVKTLVYRRLAKRHHQLLNDWQTIRRALLH